MKELIEKIRSLIPGEGIFVQCDDGERFHQVMTTDDLITLADRLAAYEELMSEADQIRCVPGVKIKWSLEKFRGEWRPHTLRERSANVYPTAIEAFAALKGETNNAG